MKLILEIAEVDLDEGLRVLQTRRPRDLGDSPYSSYQKEDHALRQIEQQAWDDAAERIIQALVEARARRKLYSGDPYQGLSIEAQQTAVRLGELVERKGL